MSFRDQLRDEPRLDAHLSVRDEPRGLRVPVAAEAEHRRRMAQLLRQVRERRDADPAAHEERALDVHPEAVAERPEDRQRVAALERRERARARADRVDQEPELVRGR